MLVTVQNHGYAVEAADGAEVSHVSLNDGTVEGLEGDGFFSLQFHPEAAPGPLDALPFFDRIADVMPKRTDLRSILIVGSGPIRIGQACEFDYSGSQACRVLRAEGYRVVLVNSNPATIMTDPSWADATYIEPLDADALAAIIEKERPDALLPTLGGQTALNLAVELAEAGVLDRFGVELIGADLDAIRRAEDRLAFRDAMRAAGSAGAGERRRPRRSTSFRPASRRRSSARPSRSAARAAAWPEPRRSSGTRLAHGLETSPIHQALVERSVEGWQEFELEVMVDRRRQLRRRLLDREPRPDGRPHRRLVDGRAAADAARRGVPAASRDAAFACARTVGVATGGANVQFAYEPASRPSSSIIEMNPRVSRSSALASKATGFPIAKLAALLAVGYTLDELPNDITGKSSAAFEPALDYVAVKAPRFDFAKFPWVEPELGTEMRAVGESLGLGRTFPEAFLKALEGREDGNDLPEIAGPPPVLRGRARVDPRGRATARRTTATSSRRSASGLPDARIARVLGIAEAEVRSAPAAARAGWRSTPARRSSRRGRPTTTSPTRQATRTTSAPRSRAILILGSGPNRIGQGIEFDYCCTHAAQAFHALGYEAVLLNSNPETVSTDYDTSDRLYLEPVTLERALDVCALEQPARRRRHARRPDAARAGPRAGRGRACRCSATPCRRSTPPRTAASSGSCSTSWGSAHRAGVWPRRARRRSPWPERIGYPVLVRPHYVLGGRRMRVARGPRRARDPRALPRRPVPRGRDRARRRRALRRRDRAGWPGILEHVEPAGSPLRGLGVRDPRGRR